MRQSAGFLKVSQDPGSQVRSSGHMSSRWKSVAGSFNIVYHVYVAMTFLAEE